MTDQTTGEPRERLKRIEARKERLAMRLPPHQQRVRVVPRDDNIRQHLKHPSGLRFPKSGSAEWPLDRFTKRRLVEGSVTREDVKPKPAAGARPTHAA
jgi:hypothetical protein